MLFGRRDGPVALRAAGARKEPVEDEDHGGERACGGADAAAGARWARERACTREEKRRGGDEERDGAGGHLTSEEKGREVGGVKGEGAGSDREIGKAICGRGREADGYVMWGD